MKITHTHSYEARGRVEKNIVRVNYQYLVKGGILDNFRMEPQYDHNYKA